MKKTLSVLLSSSVVLFASTVFGVDKAAKNVNWTCTYQANTQMNGTSKSQKTATAAFASAVKQCQNCTKISCELAG